MKFAIALFCLVIASASAHEPAPASRLIVVHFITGPAWQADKPFSEQKDASGHSQNLARMRSEGLIVIGARYADKGMIVVRAASEQDVRAQIDKDPTVQSKVFAYEVAVFNPFYEGCIVRNESKRDSCK